MPSEAPTNSGPLLALEPSSQFLRESELRRGFELLMHASQVLSSQAAEGMADEGLTADHARALFFIRQNPGLKISDLVAQMLISKQSLNRILQTLEEKKLITRKRDQVDGRARRLTLTQTGEALEAKCFGQIAGRISRGYSAVGQKAIANTWQTLMHLLDDTTRRRLLSVKPDNP